MTKRVNWLSWHSEVIRVKCSQPLHKLIFCHSKNWPPNLICDFKWDVQSVSRDPLSRKWVTKVILIKGEFQFVCGCWDSKSSYELFESGAPSLFDDFKNSVDRVKKRRKKEEKKKNEKKISVLVFFSFSFVFYFFSWSYPLFFEKT